MMRIKKLALVAIMPLMMSSCLIMSTHHTTGNPIGTKEGYVKSKMAGNFDAGIGAAAKKGGITKIGSVDIYYYSSGKFAVKVTGE
ncbi:MAG: hypothetical protein ACXVNM_04530 [Bacteroidia bacterium]